MTASLGQRMAKGAGWLVLARLAERAIGFVSTLILARILVPGDFGLVAMATALLGALELLGAFSFDLALIQNQQADRRHYDTVWTFSVAFGAFKALALVALAGPAAAFYDDPRLQALIWAIAACTLVQGFENVGIVAFQKDLELHKEFWFSLYRRLGGFAVTMVLAFWWRDYWALVAGIFASRAISLLLSYTMNGYRPTWDWSAGAELFHYSKWLLLNNFLIFVNNRGMDFVIGKVSGARALGLYSVAYEVANLPTTELVWPIQRAVFPGYARLAGDIAQLRQAFLQVIALVALITVPAGALIGLVAEPFVLVLLGPKWIDAVPLVQILAIFGIVRTIHGPTGAIYLALNQPRVVAALQCVQLAVAVAAALWWVPLAGAQGAAWAVLAGATLAMVVNYAMVLRELQLRLAALVAALWRPALGAASMAAALLAMPWATRPAATTLENALHLVGASALGAAIYLGVVLGGWWLAGKPEGAEAQLLRLAGQRLAARRQASS